MKQIFLLSLLGIVLSMSSAFSQLHEKLYDLIFYGDEVFTSIENIPISMGDGQIVVSTKSGMGNDGEQIICRLDNDGDIVWKTEYPEIKFDEYTLIRSHRIGFNSDDNTVVIVGGTGGFNSKPVALELDLDLGDPISVHYYPGPGHDDIKEGHFNAIHSVSDGTHKGSYMVGSVVSRTIGRSPVIARIGGSEFEKIYNYLQPTDKWRGYFDVDVDEKNGYVIAVGVEAEHILSGQMYPDLGEYALVDIYKTDGTFIKSHKYSIVASEANSNRWSSVKCVAPGRVILGGISDNEAVAIQIDYLSGQVHWSRTLDAQGLQLEDVIEIEQDAEGHPILFAISKAHTFSSNPEGPAILSRLNPQGNAMWSIQEELRTGFGDVEPQFTEEGNLSMLGCNQNGGVQSRLTFVDIDFGFYSCETEIELEMTTTGSEEPIPVTSPSITHLSTYSTTQLSNTIIANVGTSNGNCCWLPDFNPLPWNHPWEVTYHSEPAVIDVDNGLPSNNTYKWTISSTKEIRTGHIVPNPTPITSTSNKSVLTLDLENWSGEPVGSISAESSKVYIVAEDNDECEGKDMTNVVVAEDDYVERPDYLNTSFGNDYLHANYTYCDGNNGNTDRYLYTHQGGYFESNDFITPTLYYPNKLNTPTNYLNTTTPTTPIDYLEFVESVEDSYQAGGGYRLMEVETDLEVIDCQSCPQTLPLYETWIGENGLEYYSIETDNVNEGRKIVKYSFSIFLFAPHQPHLHKVLKMDEIPGKTGLIVADDYLIPIIDKRYLDSYSAYTNGYLHYLYLDLWYSSTGQYPYSVDCHQVQEFVSNNVVSKMGQPTQIEENEKLNNLTEINLFPNPNNGSFNIESSSEMSEIKIFDFFGKKVFSTTFTVPKKSSSVILNDVSSGIYMIEILTSEGKRTTHKISIN